MYSTHTRFSHFYWLVSLVTVVAILGGAALIALGVLGHGANSDIWMAAAGVLAIGFGIVALALVAILVKLESTHTRQLSELRDITEVLAEHAARLESVVANTDISDAAKSLVHRQRDLDSLREAIRTDMRSEAWEAATHLIDQMEGRFGSKQEAEQFRAELIRVREQTLERRLAEALQQIEDHFKKYELEQAQTEIGRLLHALPEDPRVTGLSGRLQTLRVQHKQELMGSWDDAVKRHDVDHAIEVLKELDAYLSSDEVSALESSARNIFKEKLMQLGVQFRFAVTEKRWRDALDTGAQIIREFPNARMAQEVRDKLEILRERAKHSEAQPA